MRKIVFLDRKSIGEDIDISMLDRFGKVIQYDHTPDEKVNERVRDADIVITNKSRIDPETMKRSIAKLICVTATGVDNIDLDYCKMKEIAVCNVKGYSTESVVQHTFALLFSLWERIFDFKEHIRSGKYVEDSTYSHYDYTFREMNGKKLGIIGMGTIGTRVAETAETIGFDVCYWSSSGEDRTKKYRRVDLDELIRKSDVISIHSPLNKRTEGLFGAEEFKRMKNTAILLNLGRGAIIREHDLVKALLTKQIGGAGIDVLSEEPMSVSCPYMKIADEPNFILTPHVAWAAIESRERCMNEIALNIYSWIQGGVRNRVENRLSD